MTASSANSLGRKDGNVLFLFGFLFFFQLSASSLSEWPLWTWALEGKLTWHCWQFDIVSYFSDNFVPEKLPKLYKIFVQKQSITCMEIYMYMWSITFSVLNIWLLIGWY